MLTITQFSLSQDKEVFRGILSTFPIESKTSGLLASLVNRAEKHPWESERELLVARGSRSHASCWHAERDGI